MSELENRDPLCEDDELWGLILSSALLREDLRLASEKAAGLTSTGLLEQIPKMTARHRAKLKASMRATAGELGGAFVKMAELAREFRETPKPKAGC